MIVLELQYLSRRFGINFINFSFDIGVKNMYLIVNQYSS